MSKKQIAADAVAKRIRQLIDDAKIGRPKLQPVVIQEWPPNKPNAYIELGFDSYESYRKSALWKTIKRRILQRDKDRCARCGGRGSIVHHRAYGLSIMKGEADEYLATVCEGCHQVIEIDDDGEGRNLLEKDAILMAKDCPTIFPEPIQHAYRAGVSISKDAPAEWPRMSSIQRAAWLMKALSIARTRNRKPPVI